MGPSSTFDDFNVVDALEIARNDIVEDVASTFAIFGDYTFNCCYSYTDSEDISLVSCTTMKIE